MKITIYELLGLVKDGKAPKKIKIDEDILNLEKGIETLYKFEKGGGSLAFGYYIDNNKLDDEVEILEEEKKIPERLNKNYYITQPDINQPSKVSYDMEQLLEMVQDIYEKQGEICDYLKSKGE